MVTDYRPDLQHDRALINLLFARYERVHVWLQGQGDDAYLRSLLGQSYDRLHVIPHAYDAFEAFLTSGIVFDYVGTRLHGGIRCINAGRRALIITVDNRAIELAADIGLPTVQRGNIAAVDDWITQSEAVQLRLPVDKMRTWSRQFGTYKAERL
jgi:polysaccharide pyruvyl transferase WcaK-like protein